jgi:hypothetical protein
MPMTGTASSAQIERKTRNEQLAVLASGFYVGQHNANLE